MGVTEGPQPAMTPVNHNGTDDDAVVSYSVKELLQDIKRSVDKLYGKVDRKADSERVDAIEQVVLSHSSRIDRIELTMSTDARQDTQRSEWRRYLTPVILTVFGLALTTIEVISNWGK